MSATRGTGGSEGDSGCRSRGLGGDDRAQSITIGALFIFAFLILALAIVQTVFVPQENEQVEFNHNKQVQDDMVDLRSSLLRSAATGQPRSADVRLGTSYPTRTLLLNPSPPSGTLQTTDRANISLTNAVATGGAADYFDGGNRTFRTKAVVYRPGYNLYNGAPDTVIGSSVVYERYPGDGGGTATPGSNQTVINSRTVSLVAVRGEYYQSSTTTASVDPRVLSATNRTLTVSDDGDPVVLKLPTAASPSRGSFGRPICLRRSRPRSGRCSRTTPTPRSPSSPRGSATRATGTTPTTTTGTRPRRATATTRTGTTGSRRRASTPSTSARTATTTMAERTRSSSVSTSTRPTPGSSTRRTSRSATRRSPPAPARTATPTRSAPPPAPTTRGTSPAMGAVPAVAPRASSTAAPGRTTATSGRHPRARPDAAPGSPPAAPAGTPRAGR